MVRFQGEAVVENHVVGFPIYSLTLRFILETVMKWNLRRYRPGEVLARVAAETTARQPRFAGSCLQKAVTSTPNPGHLFP